MKKQFIIILIILLIILAISGYYVYNVRRLDSLAQKNNKQYDSYYEKEILGNTLMSIINKTIDINEKNNISKQEDSIYYEDNKTNSIQITVKFLESDKIVRMEDIAEKQSENFIRYFASATFKCTKIEYHEKTKCIKSLHFEQMNNWF